MSDPVSRTTKRDQFWKGSPKPITAWAAVNRDGEIMPASIRDRPDAVPCVGCVPFRVVIAYMENQDGEI